MRQISFCITVFFFVLLNGLNAQVGINTTSPQALFHIAPSDASSPSNADGLIIPRIDAFPSTSPTANQQGMLVYLTTVNGTNSPGFYYWDHTITAWISMENRTGAELADTDADTKIHVEETADEDLIRFDLAGVEYLVLDNGRISTPNTGNSVFLGEGAGATDDLTNNNNVFVGFNAGNAIVDGIDNVAVGYNALKSTSSASNSVAIGWEALRDVDSGTNNTALGSGALRLTTSGSANTSLGVFSGLTNTTGYNNVFVGASSGRNNTTGFQNTFIGVLAGLENTTGNNNTFVGVGSGRDNTTGIQNSFFGRSSGLNHTTGNSNTFNGYASGQNSTTGYSNTFIGALSGAEMVSGYRNVFLGYGSGQNTTGNENTLIGFYAGRYLTTGSRNVIVGRLAGENATGSNNVFIGNGAGREETNSNRLYIDNSNTTTPLIFGNFDTDELTINGNSGKTASALNGTTNIETISGLTNPTGTFELDGFALNVRNTNGGVQTLSIEGALPGGTYPYGKLDFRNIDANSADALYTGGSIRSFNDGFANDGDLRFYTTNDQTLAERIRVTSTGLVGIGENNPQETLHVDGSFRLEDGNQAAGRVLTSDANGTATWSDAISLGLQDTDGDTKIQLEETTDDDIIRFDVAGNERFSLYNGTGNIETISGLTNPAGTAELDGYALNVRNSSGGIQTLSIEGALPGGVYPYGKLDFRNTDANSANDLYTGGSIRSYNDGFANDGDLRFYTTNDQTLAERIRVTSTGLVGIGENNPQETLHVAGSFRLEDGNQAAGRVLTSDANGTATWSTLPTDGDSDASNELITAFSVSGTDLSITEAGTTRTVDLSGLVDDADASTTNETITAFALSGNNLNLTEAGTTRTIDLSSYAGGNDNLGNHTATTNLQTAGNYISNDGDNEGIFVDANGQVGIGTNTPTALAEISSGTSGDAILKIVADTDNNNEADNPEIQLIQDGGPQRAYLTLEAASGTRATGSLGNGLLIGTTNVIMPMQFITNNVVRSTILPNGNFGIGETNPQATFHLNGSLRYVDGNQTAGRVLTSDANGTATWADLPTSTSSSDIILDADSDTQIQVEESADEDVIRFDVAGTQAAIINSSERGSIGIATNDPRSTIHISDGSTSSKTVNDLSGNGVALQITDNNIPRIYFEDTSEGNGDKLMDLSYEDERMKFASLNDAGNAWDSRNILVMERDGNVGIGLADPNELLHVNGSARINNSILLGTAGSVISGTNQGGSIELGPTNSASGEIPYIDFHYGVGTAQDFNVRMINDGDHRLSFRYDNIYPLRITPNGLRINQAYTLPTADGTANQVISTDGSGNLSWTDLPTGGSSSSAVVVDADSDTQIQVEESTDEDIIRFDLEGTERFVFTDGRIEVKNSNGTIAIGDTAGAALTGANTAGNTFIGNAAGLSTSAGRYNVGIGENALYNNNAATLITEASDNTAVGNAAMQQNTTGRSNTAIGRNSMIANTSGNYNTALGLGTLFQNTTGNYNTSIGYFAQFGTGLSNLSNTITLGYNSEATTSNTARIGNSSITSIGGYANWTNVSDGRFKRNIQENIVGLDFIMRLRPVSYNLDMDALHRFKGTSEELRFRESEIKKAQEIQTGFIAQEVQKAAREAGFNFHGVEIPKNGKSHYGLRYAEFVVPLTKAIQEQQTQLEEQQNILDNRNGEIKDLKNQIDKQNQLIDDLLKRMEALEKR